MNFKYTFPLITTTILLTSILFSGCQSANKSDTTSGAAGTSQPEAASPSEWISLFDGTTLQGWKRFNADEIGKMWKVEDGAIACYSEGGGEASEDGGALITVEHFDNFEFSLEWKISPGGNSGIMYHIVEGDKYRYAYETGPEYQLLDDSGWDGDLKADQITGANYDMYDAPASKTLHPPGEWNTSRIVYDHGHVEHWLNGEKILEFEEGSEDWQERLAAGKWKEYPDWCKAKSGSIGLQDHGSPIWFRNIKVRRL